MMRNTGGGRVSTRRRALGDTKKKKEGKKKKKKEDSRLTKYAEITDDGDDINVCSGRYVCLKSRHLDAGLGRVEGCVSGFDASPSGWMD